MIIIQIAKFRIPLARRLQVIAQHPSFICFLSLLLWSNSYIFTWHSLFVKCFFVFQTFAVLFWISMYLFSGVTFTAILVKRCVYFLFCVEKVLLR